MVKAKKDKVATEMFVYGVVNRSELRLEERIEQMENKMEERFDKVMEHLVDIAGKFKKFDEERVVMTQQIKRHSDRLDNLERDFKTS